MSISYCPNHRILTNIIENNSSICIYIFALFSLLQHLIDVVWRLVIQKDGICSLQPLRFTWLVFREFAGDPNYHLLVSVSMPSFTTTRAVGGYEGLSTYPWMSSQRKSSSMNLENMPSANSGKSNVILVCSGPIMFSWMTALCVTALVTSERAQRASEVFSI